MMPAVGKTFTLAQWDPFNWWGIRERMAKTPEMTFTPSAPPKQRNGFVETLYFYARPGGPPSTIVWMCPKCGETEDKGHAHGCPNTPNPLPVEVVEHAQPHAAQVRYWADWFQHYALTVKTSTSGLATKELTASAAYIERLERRLQERQR